MPLVSTFGNLSARAFGLGAYRSSIFSPSSLFAAGEQGVWYDPSDLTTMFEDAAGTTAVHTPGNGVADSPVGLLLDKHLGLVSSTKGGVGEGSSGQYFSTPYKSITTGDIDLKMRWSPTAFTTQSIFSQDNGTNRNFVFSVSATKTLSITWWESGGTLRSATSTVAATLTAGTVYWLRCTVAFNNTTLVHTATFYVNADTGNNTEPSSWTQLGSTVTQGGFVSNVRSLSCPTWVSCNFNTSSNILNGKVYFASAAATIGGSAVQTFTPTSYTSGSTFTSTSSDVWTINGTARIVPDGNHATQSTSTARPTLSARYNLLTYSEQFNNAAWGSINLTITANQTVAPDGTTTAEMISETTANAQHSLYQNPGVVSGVNYTASVALKQGTQRYAVLSFATGSTNQVRFAAVVDLQTGTITQTNTLNSPTGTSSSISSLGSGWYRVTITQAATTTAGFLVVAMSNTGTPTTFIAGTLDPSYTGNASNNIYIWGAEVRATNDGVGLPVYQRIADANTYDSVGFPYYIKFDGVDDKLATSSVAFGSSKTLSGWFSARQLSSQTNKDYFGGDWHVGSTGRWVMYIDGSSQINVAVNCGSTATATSSGYAVISTKIASFNSNANTPSLSLSINGASAASTTASQGASSLVNQPIYLSSDTTYYSNIRIYGAILRIASSTSTEISNTETWLNGKTKAY